MTNPPEPKSFASELQVLCQTFPSSLFDGEGWQRLLARAASVPASLIENTFGFELRLCREERAADFCVTIQAGSDKASEFLNFPPIDKYSGLRGDFDLPPQDSKIDGLGHFDKQILSNLLSEIARDGSFANNAVLNSGIILEFDVVGLELGQNPAPGVFLGLAKHVGSPQMSEVVQLLDIAQTQHPASSLYNQSDASKRQGKDGRVSTLRSIAEATIPYGRISQVGTFLGRETSMFRVLVRLEERATIGEYLHTIGWSGNVSTVVDVVSRFEFADITFGVALDVAADRGGVGERVGLEVAAKGTWIGTRFEDWQPLVDVLVANEWCREDKAKGLRQWCGFIRLFGPEMYMLLKGINHFKISIQNDQIYDAKAYLGARRVLARELGFE